MRGRNDPSRASLSSGCRPMSLELAPHFVSRLSRGYLMGCSAVSWSTRTGMGSHRGSRCIMAVIGGIALVVGCRCERPGHPPVSPVSSAGTVMKPPAPELGAHAPPEGSRFASNPLWARAADQAPIDLEILARSEGAVGLIEGVAVG